MASTPPLRIISSQEPPPAPRHGPTHDNYEPRYPTRSSHRIASREARVTPEPQSESRSLRSANTPESKRVTSRQSHQHNLSSPISPQNTPKHTPAKRIQVTSPSSPGIRTRSHDTSSSNPLFASSNKQHKFLSNSTVMNESMLPTPVKTPRKKAVKNVNAAARALFQDQLNPSDEIMPTPRKNRKSKRHNGFTLESFSTDDGAGPDHVQIYTDSRDNVPELDLSEDNPFVDHPPQEPGPSVQHLTGTSKRRKLSSERKKDPQVEEAIKNDKGMVYVFRGKKVYKRFDDGSEEEETTIDPDDLGLLERTEGAKDAVKLLKPLTRRSIKPTRLFQSEEQKRAREAEKAEEEVTDIEEQPSTDAAEPPLPSAQAASNNRRSKRTAAMKSAQTAEEDAQAEANGPETDEVNGEGSPVVEKVKKPKRSSPFDSWKRLKPGATASPVAANKGRKRTSTALGEDERSSTGKKLRNR